jgi:hypothetical protein
MTALARIEMKRGPRKWQSQVRAERPKDLPPDVVQVMVDNPYDHGPVKIPAFASLRDDILGHLHARQEIDDAKLAAGRQYEILVEQAQVGTVKAMDTTKEPVDGGGVVFEPLTDEQLAAARKLHEAARWLGRRGEALVRLILVERRKFKEIAPSLSERDVAYTRRQFFDCLEELAVLWCLAGRK